MFSEIAYSVLDLATIIEGGSPADTFPRSLDLARHVEKWGYKRYWLAEHHNIPNVASSATAVLIGYIAGGTSTIRVGSGGIMLPNHAPLIVAEQFGTLASLYPGRIDLGLGRAPGSDQATALEIRGANFHKPHNFAGDIQKLQHYFSADSNGSRIRAIPGEGLDIPLWILGSSTDSALVAAQLGLPYAFASHFAPAQFLEATRLYRQHFQPSKILSEPYIIACVNVVAADTDLEANRLATSIRQFILGIVSGRRRPLQPPVDDMAPLWTSFEEEAVNHMLSYAFIGSPKTLKAKLRSFLENTGVNEIMATAHVFDHAARLHSYELFAATMKEMLTAAVQ